MIHTFAIALISGSLSQHAVAEVPLVEVYPQCGEEDRPDLCPPDLNERWWMISYIPAHTRDSVREAEQDLGSGVSVDRAYRITVGQWEAILAVADSGIEWENTHLAHKFYLNRGELPVPQDAKGNEAKDYDLNEDGVFNIEDWADDPRVDITAGRDIADEMLDPSDLIYTFSDGVDDDGNGYTDDISGWDFFGRDNDAYNDFEGEFGRHGSGVAEDFGAEGGQDTDTTIGICPNCAVLPVRVGDTFVTDGMRAGEGIAFAVDSGAVAITQSIGALSNPEMALAAVQYAWDMDVTIVGAAGDENAYHHNFPAVLDNVLYVHSIMYDAADDDNDDIYSYMNTWNCNNYGARMDLVAPNNACATGAVAVITGAVGMLHSAAWEHDTTLQAGEVTQLLVSTVDDVNLSDSEREISDAYPSHAGWDPFYGYGRVNVGDAVAAVAAGEIPPWATIDTPKWFQVFDPSRTPTVAVDLTLSAERSDSFIWVLEVATGHDPDSWTTVDSGSGSGRSEETVSVDVSALDYPNGGAVTEAVVGEGVIERLERVNQPAVTLRLTITDAEGLEGVSRKTFFAAQDDDMLDGFPLDMGASGEGSPILADLDGDGIFEIVIGTASGDVLALTGEGENLSGWPVSSEVMADAHPNGPGQITGALPEIREGFSATVAVGDLDGDGWPEVVAAGSYGGLYAWHADGSLVDGFPVYTIGREPEEFTTQHTYDQGYAGAPVLVDIDGDGNLEIISLAMDSRLYVNSHDGSDWGPYPIEICHPELCGEWGFRAISSPSVGDVDGDGELEVGFGTNEATGDGSYSVSYLMDLASGTDESGWPFTQKGLVAEALLLPMVGEGHPASQAFADIDGDGDLEIADPIMLGMNDILHHDTSSALPLNYYAQDFTETSNADDVPTILQMVTNPAWGDLNLDGTPDLAMGGASTWWLVSLAFTSWVDFQQPVGLWSGRDGTMMEGWPRQIEDIQFLVSPAIADVSGDEWPEVIYASGGYLVHAWDHSGAETEGWPKHTGGWLLGSPAVGDVTGDGYLEVVVSTREGFLFAWSTAGHADQDVQWASMHHDPQNTGNYETPLVSQDGPPGSDSGTERGCCKNRKNKGSWMLWPLGIGFLARYRRKRF